MSQGLEENVVEYSFAVEYHGPPITHELPRAVPINVDRIPIASAVSQLPYSDKLFLPIVQPISSTEMIIGSRIIRNSKSGSPLCGELLTVSPNSVIAFESRSDVVSEGSFSKELGLGIETAFSPSLVDDVSEEEPGISRSEGDFMFSGDLSCELECFRDFEVKEMGFPQIERDHSTEFVNEGVTSGDLVFSGSFGKSRELLGSLHESVFSEDCPSFQASCGEIGDRNNLSCSDVRKDSVVAICGNGLDDRKSNGELICPESEVVRTNSEPPVKFKKGACYRCFKGTIFTEKEVCLVCDAKYCSNCVLRAMGSMPEGRKCVTCIGFAINELKRGNLGKCSRMLKRLLNELEVRQIMKTEKFCEVNQLPAEYICVNGRPLCHDEFIMLQSCPNPPKKLKPGNYWYDKVSGLWGKEGQKPSLIISPHLNIGPPVKPDASNGNTKVFINGREITKSELRLLKLAGVQCAGNPHFWVNEDGSYQEEGQKNTKGFIWGKAGTKLLCALLSLPAPSKSTHPSADQETSTVTHTLPSYLDQRVTQKLLLMGCNGSGTSTLFKQAKILYKTTPFSEGEREHMKMKIQSNVYSYIGILLEGRERFEEEMLSESMENQSCDGLTPEASDHADGKDAKTLYSISPRLKAFSDWLLKIMASGTLEAVFPAASREYAPLVEELWCNVSFQATYKRRNELEALPSIASYFLDRAVEILQPDYTPSDMDIMYAERVTASNGLSCVEFSLPESSVESDTINEDATDSLRRFQLIRLRAHGYGENWKWLQMFEDVGIIIFCVSLSEYDQFGTDEEGNPVNKMLLTKKFFENMVTHPAFAQTTFLLILNKFDLFEEKIEKNPLTQCDWFEDFCPVISRSKSKNANHTSLGQMGFHFVAFKFKRLYTELTGRKLYTSLVKGLEPKSVDAALKYAKEILSWDVEKQKFGLIEDSFYSNDEEEPSSYSR